jgi:hypothetical protein
MFTLADLQRAADLVAEVMPPTAQYAWPLLAERYGVEIVVKHENHTPTGAFKVRGGLVYMERLRRERPGVAGIVSATRGNHGQSLAFAGRRYGVPVTIVVPEGNAREKNLAMRGFGAELIEAGRDFDEAKAVAARVAAERGLEYAPPFHEDLVLGVATYGLELFRAHPDLHTVYVPIGGGSGICGLISARDLLGLDTRIVGVVSDRFDAYARSVECGSARLDGSRLHLRGRHGGAMPGSGLPRRDPPGRRARGARHRPGDRGRDPGPLRGHPQHGRGRGGGVPGGARRRGGADARAQGGGRPVRRQHRPRLGRPDPGGRGAAGRVRGNGRRRPLLHVIVIDRVT